VDFTFVFWLWADVSMSESGIHIRSPTSDLQFLGSSQLDVLDDAPTHMGP